MKKQIKVFLVMLLFLLFIGTTTVNAGMITPDSVAEGTYIIGTNMFTGGITSQEMMYAARSIKIPEEVTEPIKQLEYMNMYIKDLEGEWIDGINGQPISESNLPKEFYIECKDLVEIKAVTVSKEAELRAAIEDVTVERIILQEWIWVEEPIEINRSVTLAGYGGIYAENDSEYAIVIGENGILVIEGGTSIDFGAVENNGLIINGIPVQPPIVRQMALMSLQNEMPAHISFSEFVQNNGRIINNGDIQIYGKVQGNGTFENNEYLTLWDGVELTDIQGLQNNGKIEKYVGENAEELQAALNNNEIQTVSLTQNIEIQESIVINRPVTLYGCGWTISFATRPDEWITDGNNYVLKVYNTEATISEIGLTNSLAGMLVSSSDVTLSGRIDVSGNKVGGIEVSKAKDLTRMPSLKGDNEYYVYIANEQEQNLVPTIWEDGVENCVDLESLELEKVTGYEENKTFYFNSIPYIEVTSTEQLEKILKTNIEEISLGASFTTDHSIVINRPVTLYGLGNTISFETQPEEWVENGNNYVLKIYNTEATIDNITLTNSLAGMLVSSSDVTLRGQIYVSGNTVGGIEVSKGSGLTRMPSLKGDNDAWTYIGNEQEQNLVPTVWEDGVENCVDLENLELEKVTGIEPNKTFYFNDESVLLVDNVEKLKKLLATNVEQIDLEENAHIEVADNKSIVINRPVTINGNNATISFVAQPEEWVENGDNYVLKVYNTEATISNIRLTNSLAGMLVASSDVTLSGDIDVSRNKVGGIEVSKGSELTRKPSLNVVENTNIINNDEYSMIPTIWEDGVENCVNIDLKKVTGYEENKTFYFNSIPNIEVTSTEQLEKLLKTNLEVISLGASFTTDHSIVINRPVRLNGGGNTISFKTQPEEWATNGDNYVLKIYNTEVTIDSITLTNALAGMLVSSSDVTLSGAIDVSGNKVGGIEVSKGSGLTRMPSLKALENTNVYTSDEYLMIPTIWEDGVENCVNIDLEKVTGYEENKTFYFNQLPYIEATSVEQLEKLLKTNIEVIRIGADIVVTDNKSIIINRPVTIEGQGYTISFAEQPDEWVTDGDNYVLKVYNTEAKICNLNLTNALAGMLVSSSDVILSGNINVSGNKVGGIEVTKGSELTRMPTLKGDTEFVPYISNDQEQNQVPTVWEDGVEDCVDNTETLQLQKATVPEKPGQTFYFNTLPTE